MGKIGETRKLYRETLGNIAKTEENWLSFLDSVSWHFKYNFIDKVLIYAQRPDATACAEMENEWNKKCKRWVNKNANGIFVLSKDDDDPYPFRIVFDVSDTHNSKGTEYKLWNVKPEYEEEIIETLETTFGGESESKDLSTNIIASAYNMVTDNIQDYLSAIYNNKNGTLLDGLSDDEIKNITISTVWASVSYMMMARCGINAREKISTKEFLFIKYFNKTPIVTALGTAISDIAEMGLREIAKTVINLQNEEKKRNHTFVKNDNKEYSNNKEIDEGGIRNDEHRIQESRRLQYTKSSDGERENTRWQIRKNEVKLPKEQQESRIFNIIDGEEIERRIDNSSRESNTNDKGNSREISETREYNRGIESRRPNEMDRTNEQLQDDSRGTSSEGTNLQLNIWREDTNSNIEKFEDYETIDDILTNAPNIIKSNQVLEEYLKFNSDQNRKEYIKNILGNAYTEYETELNQRVGYRVYENGLYLWKGKYLNRTKECFKDWDYITEHFVSKVLQKENDNIVNNLPTEKEQKEIITEANASVFSFSQEDIDNILKRGSGFENGKFRIYHQLNKGLSKTENAEFLKNEYGIGGRNALEGFSEDHNSKGITISNEESKLTLKWQEVEKRIRELISANRYLNENEKDEYYDWLDANDIKPLQNESELKLNTEDYEFAKRLHSYIKDYDIVSYHNNFPLENTDEENIELLKADIEDELNIRDYIDFLKASYEDLDYDDEISVRAKELIAELDKRLPYYEFNNGDIVYIGTEEYEIRTVNDERVVLVDTSFPLFTKEMERQEFNKKIKENPANDKLRTGKRLQAEEKNVEQEIKPIQSEEQIKINNNIPTIEDTQKEESKELEILKPNIKTKRRNKIEYFDLHPEIAIKDRNNFKIQDNDLGIGGKKEKYKNNISAIKILKQCEKENRYATKEEQEILSRYVGWGGLQEAFDSRVDSWNAEYNELKSLLTEKEYNEARKSVNTAFYTPPTVIRAIYRALMNMGLEKGNILEPSCRSRKFYGNDARYFRSMQNVWCRN